MAREDLEPLLDLSGRPHRPRARGFGISTAERIRAARNVPQAVVKVTGFSHGFTKVQKYLDYISRMGKLVVEKDTGELLTDLDMQQELLDTWSDDFGSNPRSRDAAKIVFSAPPGSDVNALRQAVRVTGAKAFPNHEWVFAIHLDREHPHAHMVVKMRDRSLGRKLQLRKGDLYQLRETFAEAAREQGLSLAASPRAARGAGPPAVPQSLFYLKWRGQVPRVEQNKREIFPKPLHGRAAEKAMALRREYETKKYFRDAEALRQAAENKEGPDREKLLRAAQDLEDFAKTLQAKTRRQTLSERTISSLPAKQQKAPRSGLELDL